MSQTQEQILSTALYHLDKALSHAAAGLSEEIVLDACALRLVAMVDACSKLAPEELLHLFGRDWPLMRGMRNRIMHGYAVVSAEVLRQTIEEELPLVREKILRSLG